MVGSKRVSVLFKAAVVAAALSAGATQSALNQIDQANGLTQVNPDGTTSLTASGEQYQKLSSLDKMQTATYWQKAGATAAIQGTTAQAQGGSFVDAATGALVRQAGSGLNAAVGDYAKDNNLAEGSLSKILLHSAIGAGQASLTQQDATAGAIGGAMAETLSSINTSLDQSTGNKISSQLLTAGAAMVVSEAVKPGSTQAMLTAANQALQTDAFNRQLHPSETKLAADLAAKSGGKFTAQQIADALRGANNTVLGETAVSNTLVNASLDKAAGNNPADGIASKQFDQGASFNTTTMADGDILKVQNQPSAASAELMQFIQANTGSTYTWSSPTPADLPTAWTSNGVVPIINATGSTNSYMGTNSAGLPGNVVMDNRSASEIDKATNDFAKAVAVVPAAVAAVVVAPGPAAISGGVNTAAQLLSGEPFSPTEAVISTVSGPIGEATAGAQAVSAAIQNGSTAAATAIKAAIGATTNVVSDATAKTLTGEEITATGTVQAGIAGAGGSLPKSAVMQSTTTEAIDAAPKFYEAIKNLLPNN